LDTGAADTIREASRGLGGAAKSSVLMLMAQFAFIW